MPFRCSIEAAPPPSDPFGSRTANRCPFSSMMSLL